MPCACQRPPPAGGGDVQMAESDPRELGAGFQRCRSVCLLVDQKQPQPLPRWEVNSHSGRALACLPAFIVSGLWKCLLNPFIFYCHTCKGGHYLPQLLARAIKMCWSSKAFADCKVLYESLSCRCSHYVLRRSLHIDGDALRNTGDSLRSAALSKY